MGGDGSSWVEEYRVLARAWKRADGEAVRNQLRPVIVEHFEAAGARVEDLLEELTTREVRLAMGLGMQGALWNALYFELQRREVALRRSRRVAAQVYAEQRSRPV